MLLRTTPRPLRHIPAVVAFWSIALATFDPRLGSPVLGVTAAAVGVGLLLRRPFARPMGMGLAGAWVLDALLPGLSLPDWSSVEVACAGLGVLALVTLLFAPARERHGARGALAAAAVGLMATRVAWHGYDELWVLRDHALTLAALGGAGLLAIRRPREAASLVVALGVVSLIGWPLRLDDPLVYLMVASWWWVAEHGLRGVEDRARPAGRWARHARWGSAAALICAASTLGWSELRWGVSSALHLGFLLTLGGALLALAWGLGRGRAWAAPLAVGVGAGTFVYGWWSFGAGSYLLFVPAILLAPGLGRLDAYRGVALAGLGVALVGGAHYAFFRNAWGDPGNAALALAGLGAIGAGAVGLSRGRTWGVLASLAALGLLVVSQQAISGLSAFDRAPGCLLLEPFPVHVAFGGLAVTLAVYARPLIVAARAAARPPGEI